MKNYKLILQSLLFLSCVLTSLIYAKDNKVVFVTLGEMSFVRDDSLYGNQTLKVPEINQNVMDNGGVLAFIERPANDDRPQRWSQLPQLTLAWDTPTYMYLSHGLGLVRLSYQSSKSITDAVEYTKGNRLKLVISE